MIYKDIAKVRWEVVGSSNGELSSTKVAAYQGKEGSYSARATSTLYPGSKLMSCHSVIEACNALKEGRADVLVLPLENTTAGMVNEVYDRIFEFKFYIVQALIMPIRHCLMAKRGSKIQDIKEIYSHQQALDQCSEFIAKNDLKAFSVLNTSYAAEMTAKQADESIAAIGSRDAAEIYGLEVLKEDISNTACNQTRFIALSNSPIIMPSASKISLAFTLPHECGSLVKALSIFSEKSLSLTKIQSRPIANAPWEYSFYLDFKADMRDLSAKNKNDYAAEIHSKLKDHSDNETLRAIDAIEALNLMVPSLHMLGWYPETDLGI